MRGYGLGSIVVRIRIDLNVVKTIFGDSNQIKRKRDKQPQTSFHFVIKHIAAAGKCFAATGGCFDAFASQVIIRVDMLCCELSSFILSSVRG